MLLRDSRCEALSPPSEDLPSVLIRSARCRGKAQLFKLAVQVFKELKITGMKKVFIDKGMKSG